MTAMVIVATLLAAILVLAMNDRASAQSGPQGTCSGDVTVTFGSEYFGLGDFGNRLMSSTPQSRTYDLPSPMPAGTWDVTAVSYDGYTGRDSISPQTQEQWYTEFLAADGTVLATSGTSADIEDSVIEAEWAGSLGSVTLAAEATTIRTVHVAPGAASVNSVRPTCIGASLQATTPELSTISVTIQHTDASSSTLTLTCGTEEQSATGRLVQLLLDDIEGPQRCEITYPTDAVCAVVVSPTEATTETITNGIAVTVPEATDVEVTITCRAADTAVTTTTLPDATATTTTTVATGNGTATTTTTVATNTGAGGTGGGAATTTTTIATQVQGQVETAPTAQAQPGTPTFTG